ncbi:MAG: AEC family transporter [Oscillospiraceae bacterium]|nr:AEC family transporter [Oscillospiraceae bacterium]
MLDVFLLTLNKVVTLLIYIAIGYYLRRKHLLPEQAGRMLSLLCVMLFSPAYSILNISKSMQPEVLLKNALLVGWGVLFIVVAIIIGRVLAKPLSRSPMENSSLTYAFTFPNYGYFGYPVIEGVFGQAGLGNFMIFAIPSSLMCYSYGYVLFRKEEGYSIKKLLKAPLVVSLIIGIVIGLSGIKLPGIITGVLDGAGKCMSPCSMLLAGFMLGKFPLKQLFSGVRPYLLTAIRMLGIPAALGIVMYLCGVRGDYLFWPLIFVSLPLGLNLVVYPESLGYEKEAADNAKLCFVSYVLALVILPCVFAFLQYICY